MRVLAAGLAIVAALAAGGCQPARREAAETAYRLRRLPPQPKEIVAGMFAISQTPLTVSPLCAGVGTEADDTTIGHYLSGFLAELSDPEAKNAVKTSAEEGKSETGEAVWVCRVMIQHAQGEDIWNWGVEYSVRAADGVVLPGTVRCLGGG